MVPNDERNFSVGFARREANVVAHTLARSSRLFASPTTFHVASSCIASLINDIFLLFVAS